MSEKSFAVISVATALVCGAFFYPPPPPHRAQQLQQPDRDGRQPPAKPVPATRNPTDAAQHAWWRTKLAQLKPSARFLP